MAEATAAEKAAESLRTIWLVFGVMALIVCFAVHAVTQGTGGLVVGLKGIIGLGFADGMPEAIAAFWGAMLLPILMAITGVLLLQHARTNGTGWASRYPFRLRDMPPESGIGRVVQGTAIVVFTLLPMGMAVHSWRVFIKFAALCVAGEGEPWVARPLSAWQWFLPVEAGKAVRLGHADGQSVEGLSQIICAGGRTIDYFLPVETYLMAAMTVLAALLAGWGLFEVFRGRPVPTASVVAQHEDLGTDG